MDSVLKYLEQILYCVISTAIPSGNLIVSFFFAIAVLNHASKNKAEIALVGPKLWAMAVFFSGFNAVLVYIVHFESRRWFLRLKPRAE